MYGEQGPLDLYFIMLYGSVMTMAALFAVYLWFRHTNIVTPSIESPRELRRWAAAFMAAVAASHVWWAALARMSLDDKLVRDIIGITLDRTTFVPLMMCLLIRMLQDRKRKLWPVFVIAVLPVAATGVVCLVTYDNRYETYIEAYTAVLIASFAAYMVLAVRRYGRWLRDNYADLEHKGIWQSLLFLACLIAAFAVYATNVGQLSTEYAVQVLSVVILCFVFWRVETLSSLTPDPSPKGEGSERRGAGGEADLLRKYCEEAQLYLRHDLTLAQLALAIGSNRTYLSSYFAERGESYNTYINNLRIDHFVRLYNNARAEGRSVTAKELAYGCGYGSYSTFSMAFKQRMGQTVTEWMRTQEEYTP